MRKALIGLMLAATVMTPVAAEARGGREPRGGDRGEARSARVQQQHQQRSREPRQAREDAPAPQQQQQQVQQQQVQQQQVRQQQVRQQQVQTQQVVQRRGGGGNDGNRGGDRRVRNQPSAYPQAWQGNPNDPRLRHYQELERRNQQNGARRDDRRDWRNDRRDDRRDTRNGRNWRNDWNRGWRNDRRYDWNSWRGRNRNIFHISPYYSPYRDWRYQRFSIGFFLEPLFFDQRYWIGDPWQYRLPPAPYGTQWVRYYDDVLLVDIYSGEVVDTLYDFFW